MPETLVRPRHDSSCVLPRRGCRTIPPRYYRASSPACRDRLPSHSEEATVSESSGDLLLQVTPRGATVRRAGALPALLAAADLPEGGMVALDLLDPGRVQMLFLTADHWPELAEQVGPDTDLDALSERLRGRVETLDLPESWLRLAWMTGLARWYADPLDEGLLAADLAAAQQDAGLSEAAAASLRRAEPSLRRLATHGLAPELRDEVERVLRTVGGPLAELDLRTATATDEGLFERAVAVGGQRGSVIPLGQDNPRQPVVDPRHLSARVLREAEARAREEDDGLVVTCPAYSADAHTVEDLVVNAYATDGGTPRLIGSAPLVRRHDTYRAVFTSEDLRQRWRAARLPLELRSVSSPHGPLIDHAEARARRSQQVRWTEERRTGSRRDPADPAHVRKGIAEHAAGPPAS